MRALTAAALVLLLSGLSGCVDPSFPLAWRRDHERERASAPDLVPQPVVPPGFDLNVRVSRETADGLPLQGAEVVAFVLGPDGKPSGPSIPAATTRDGLVRFTFSQATAVAVRATLPGWTQEGVRVDVGPTVEAEGATVSGRDLFLPLYRASLPFTATLSLSTATVLPGDEPGTVRMPLATAPLDVPDLAKEQYLARLTAAEVTLRWEDTPTSRADLAAGLAWDGRLWQAGEGSGPGLGPRQASFSGALPAEGRPVELDAARLQAAAVIGSAVVGDVPVEWQVALRFAGRVPDGLPSACHAMDGACVPPLPPVPPLPMPASG